MENSKQYLEELKIEIEKLIELDTEGDFWDFKEKWCESNSDLLHDIICMANNLVDRDAYIIIGVAEDKLTTPRFHVKGVTDENRKNQQNLIDFLKDKNFSGGVRPTVYVKTILIDDTPIDVIIIKNTNNTPYYLTQKYQEVYQGHIYTRIGDTNTPKTDTANDDKVSILWKKRFGLNLTPYEKAKFLLMNPADWLPMGTDGVHSSDHPECQGIWYNKQNPEFRISLIEDETRFDQGKIDRIESTMYWMNRLYNALHHSYLYKISVEYFSTILFSSYAVILDNFRFQRVFWKHNYIENPKTGAENVLYCYIEKDSLDFLLDNWLCNCSETVTDTEQTQIRSSLDMTGDCIEVGNPYLVVPVFENTNEHKTFINYVKSRIDEFFNEVGYYSYKDSKYKNSKDFTLGQYPDYIEYLCKSWETLVNWLDNWRTIQ